MNRQDIIVVGGGIIGVTTAYELAHRGHRTTLLEARDGIALETTYANGALLTPSMSDPWNAPGVHRSLIASLFDAHSPMKLRLSAIPSLSWWGLRFLRNSNAERYAVATRASFVLGNYSVACTRKLTTSLGLEYGAATCGAMKVFRNLRSMSSGRALAEQLAPLGLRFDVLGRDGAIAAEPALEGIREQIAGALRFPDDAVGDSFKFCEALTDAFRHAGGELRTGVQVSGIAVDRGKAVGVISSAGRVRADTVVVAAGRATPGLVRHLGIALPIRPVKGYTVTFDASRVEGRPAMAVIDDDLHAAIVPLGTRLRVAGTAEFAGEDLRLRPERIENLLKLLSAIYPRIAARLDLAGGYAWTGLRPMSADGLPFVGATRVPGLYINAGHGHLGWTHACGSAHLVADLIAGGLTEIDPEPYRATR